ncbi:MAG: 1-acyl-sn-glycerol-3-phosphate acyltransferase [Gammaproteobacteria bacterium]|nr:1-acyl-sn-glycerol-3-phosphate acyltransferase [Gammaproteobacteria bacterium]
MRPPGTPIKGFFARFVFVLHMGLCFLLFGLGAVILSLVCLLSWLVPVGKVRRQTFCRRIVGVGFRTLVEWINLTRIGTIRFEGVKKLHSDLRERPSVVIANHPTLIDVVVMIAFVPELNCVVKSSIWKNPFMGVLVRSCGYIANNQGSKVLEMCSAVVRGGQSLIIFPEGSRTTPGMPSVLSRGAANVAISAQSHVAIIKIDAPVAFLTKELSWYRIPKCYPVLILSYEGQTKVASVHDTSRSRVARETTARWTELFNKGIYDE